MGCAATTSGGSPSDWPTTWEAHDGYRIVWVVDPEWRSCEPGKRCRMNGRHVHCDNEAVAELDRRHGRGPELWYAYCEDHLYGRRWWHNAVWNQRRVPLDDSEPAP